MFYKKLLDDTDAKRWLYAGVIFILVASSITILGGGPSVVRPTPSYLVMSSWLVSYFSILVMPSLYIMEFLFIQNIKNSIGKVSCAIILVSFLNFIDIYMSWDTGVKVNGADYVQNILYINIIAFIILIILFGYSYIRNSKQMLYFANLYLFGLLSWCAFPYLGELP